MNGDSRTHGLWEASAPPAAPTHPLTGRVQADVAIIGAGFTGSSAALHLAQQGASAVVLEATDVGFGASGRNVGLVNAGMWVMPSVLVDELGKTYGERLLNLLGNGPAAVFDLIARHRIECEAMHTGTLHCAVGRRGAAEVGERARQWLELGAPVELLGAQRTQQLTGTSAYAASLLDRRAGTVQPLAYVRGLAAAALRAGARIHTQTRVTAVERSGDEWQLATSSGGSVSARWVIVATDAYATGHLWPALQCEQVHFPYFNFATAPLDQDAARSILPGRQGAWDTRQVLSSFRLDAAGRLVFGSVGALRGMARDIHHAWARRALARLFPRLKNVPFEHEWYGTIGMTRNALPRLHELDRNVLSFSGFNGRGIAPGTVLGRELARLALGETRRDDMPLPFTEVVPASWRRARSLGYEAGAQAFHWVDARI